MGTKKGTHVETKIELPAIVLAVEEGVARSIGVSIAERIEAVAIRAARERISEMRSMKARERRELKKKSDNA